MDKEPLFSRAKGFASFCLWAFFVGGTLRFFVAISEWGSNGRNG